MARKKTEFQKHPVAIAWDQWLESDDGKKCMQLPVTESHFLKNRLHNAFMLGWDAREKYYLQQMQGK